MNVEISAAGKTDIGCVRQNNEDNFFIEPSIGLFVVADGMGGHASGEVASKMTTEIMKDYCMNTVKGRPAKIGDDDPDFSEAANHLGSSIRLANMAVYEASASRPELKGMGTTVAAVQVNGKRLSIAHVGDSRVYLVRAGSIEQLTDDHSVVYEQYKRELITKEEAAKSEMKNLLTRAVGIADEVDVDLSELTLAPNDILMLCSDGLYGMVEEEKLLTVLTATDNPELACEQLVSLANDNGGKDNITVIVVYLGKKKGFFSFIINVFKRSRR